MYIPNPEAILTMLTADDWANLALWFLLCSKACAVVCNKTHTPTPGTWQAKVYAVLEWFADNGGLAKEVASPKAALAELLSGQAPAAEAPKEAAPAPQPAAVTGVDPSQPQAGFVRRRLLSLLGAAALALLFSLHGCAGLTAPASEQGRSELATAQAYVTWAGQWKTGLEAAAAVACASIEAISGFCLDVKPVLAAVDLAYTTVKSAVDAWAATGTKPSNLEAAKADFQAAVAQYPAQTAAAGAVQ